MTHCDSYLTRFLDQALRWVNMCCIYGGTSRYSSGTYINWIWRNLSYQGMYLALLALSVWCPVASDYVPRTRIFNFGLAATRNIALKQCRVHANKIKFDWLNKSFAFCKSESTLHVYHLFRSNCTFQCCYCYNYYQLLF